MAQKKQPMSPLDRAILAHERGIRVSKERIAAIQEDADEEIGKIKKSIARRQIILDAIKTGALKP